MLLKPSKTGLVTIYTRLSVTSTCYTLLYQVKCSVYYIHIASYNTTDTTVCKSTLKVHDHRSMSLFFLSKIYEEKVQIEVTITKQPVTKVSSLESHARCQSPIVPHKQQTTTFLYRSWILYGIRFSNKKWEFKGACSDPQPHPPNFFQTYGDFGTKSWVIFRRLLCVKCYAQSRCRLGEISENPSWKLENVVPTSK